MSNGRSDGHTTEKRQAEREKTGETARYGYAETSQQAWRRSEGEEEKVLEGKETGDNRREGLQIR